MKSQGLCLDCGNMVYSTGNENKREVHCKICDKTTTSNYVASLNIGYFEAHKARMLRNDAHFRIRAKELLELGCECLVPKSGYIHFMHVFNETHQCFYGFGEVPYRFHMYYDIPTSHGHGSSAGNEECYDLDEGFTAEEIKAYLHPIVKGRNHNYLINIKER